MAVKRGRTEPIIEEAFLCARMGWTLSELRSQPTRFIELLSVYLSAMDYARIREEEKLGENLENGLRRLRL